MTVDDSTMDEILRINTKANAQEATKKELDFCTAWAAKLVAEVRRLREENERLKIEQKAEAAIGPIRRAMKKVEGTKNHFRVEDIEQEDAGS